MVGRPTPNAYAARSWVVIFVIVTAGNLVVAIAENGKATAGRVALAIATGIVIASGIVLGGPWLKRRDESARALWIAALLVVVVLAFLGARLV
jgi:hypothetical protein